MFKKILLAVVVILALLVVVGLFLPSIVRVERSTVIAAPQGTVFALVNGFKNFNKWSPWYEVDPGARYELSGPDFGLGARISWTSDNPDVGAGSQEIVESVPYRLVRLELDFGEQGKAKSFFRLDPEAGGTATVWGFETDLGSNLVSRYYGLLFDRIIGADYEKGLAGLKQLAESLPQADWTGMEIGIILAVPVEIAYAGGTSGKEPGEISAALAAAYAEVSRFVARNPLKAAGAPVAIYRSSDPGYIFDAGIPIERTSDREIAGDARVKLGQTYGGKAVKAIHVGPYRGIAMTMEKVMAFIAAHGLEVAGDPWEQYVSDPGNTPEEELITHLYMPVK